MLDSSIVNYPASYIKGRREHFIMGSCACQCDQARRGSWVPHTNTGHNATHPPIEYLYKKRKKGMYEMFHNPKETKWMGKQRNKSKGYANGINTLTCRLMMTLTFIISAKKG